MSWLQRHEWRANAPVDALRTFRRVAPRSGQRGAALLQAIGGTPRYGTAGRSRRSPKGEESRVTAAAKPPGESPSCRSCGLAGG